MSAEQLSSDEATRLGQRLIDQPSNLLIASFAAEIIGESYPLPASMVGIVFRNRNPELLGRSFAKWCDDQETK